MTPNFSLRTTVYLYLISGKDIPMAIVSSVRQRHAMRYLNLLKDVPFLQCISYPGMFKRAVLKRDSKVARDSR